MPPNLIGILLCPTWLGDCHFMFNDMRFQNGAFDLNKHPRAAVGANVNTK
jgi:hypothetical protein